MELFKYFGINKNAIYLKSSKQLYYKLVYRFKLIKLKIFKTYIKIDPTNSFIQLFKSHTKASILLNTNLDYNLYFCIYH